MCSLVSRNGPSVMNMLVSGDSTLGMGATYWVPPFALLLGAEKVSGIEKQLFSRISLQSIPDTLSALIPMSPTSDWPNGSTSTSRSPARGTQRHLAALTVDDELQAAPGDWTEPEEGQPGVLGISSGITVIPSSTLSENVSGLGWRVPGWLRWSRRPV